MFSSSRRLSSRLVHSKLSKVPVSPTLHINETMKKMKADGKNVYHFGFGQSPFPIPQMMVESLQQHASEKDYLPTRGLLELRETIVGHLQREFGLDQFTSEGIMIGPGSKQLLYQLFLLFNGEIMLASPSWVSYYPQCVLADKKVTLLDTSRETNWHVTPEELEKKCIETDINIPKLLLLNSPCNPTGQCYTKEELIELTKIFRKYNITVIADEIYGQLEFEGKFTSFASVYPERTIVSSGCSKAHGAGGWRLGYVAVPPALQEIMHPMDCIASETFSAVAAPIQFAAVTGFQANNQLTSILEKKRRILTSVSNFVHQSLSDAGVEVLPAKGGFYMFPDFENFREKLAKKGIVNSKDFCNTLLNESGVGILPGSAFLKDESSLTARLAFVNFDGGVALEKLDGLPKELPVPESFVREYCPDTVNGTKALCSWLSNL